MTKSNFKNKLSLSPIDGENYKDKMTEEEQDIMHEVAEYSNEGSPISYKTKVNSLDWVLAQACREYFRNKPLLKDCLRVR